MREINSDCRATLASGFATEESLMDIRLAGLAGSIRKPFSGDQFTALIDSAEPDTSDLTSSPVRPPPGPNRW